MNCIVRLSGLIEEGDAERLEKVLVSILGGGRSRDEAREYCFNGTLGCLNSDKKRICLSSPGGSIVEALKIIELIDGFMGTAVPRGADCLSACALVFMAGSSASGGPMGTAINRKLHAAGRLGFHAPSLEVEDRRYTKTAVENAYRVANEALSRLMLRSSGMLLSQTLIAEMLATPPKEMMFVDTVYDAGRWLIPIAGTIYPRQITATAAVNACNAYYNWVLERLDNAWVGTDANPVWRYGFDPVFEKNDDLRVKVEGFGPEAAMTCTLRITLEPNAKDTLSLWGYYAHVWIGDEGFEASPATFFDPLTPLSTLVRPQDEALAFRDVPDVTPEDLKLFEETRCYLFDGREELRNEQCRRETSRRVSVSGLETAISTFLWVSGTQTSLSIDRWDPTNKMVDGAKVIKLSTDRPVQTAECYRHINAQTTFCFD